MTRHFLRDDDLSPAEQAAVLDLADRMKADRFGHRPLAGPQTGRRDLREAVHPDPAVVRGRHRRARRPSADHRRADAPSSAGARPIEDTARVLSRYVAAIVIRTFGQDRIGRAGRGAAVPVVNALTDRFHPCQVLADLQTVRERARRLAGLTADLRRRRRQQHGALLPARRGDRRACTYGSPRPPASGPTRRCVAGAAAARRADRRLGAGHRGTAEAACAGADVAGHRRLDVDGAGGRGADRIAAVPAVPGQRGAAGPAAARRDRAALPARAPRRGDHRRGASTARTAPSSTRPRTGCTRRRRCSPGCWPARRWAVPGDRRSAR